MAATEFLGIKYASVLAGFAGGVVSLSFVKPLTKFQMVMAVVTGAVTATYLTPIAMGYASHLFTITPEMENGFAFIVGLTAMNVIPAIVSLSELVRRKPRMLISSSAALEPAEGK